MAFSIPTAMRDLRLTAADVAKFLPFSGQLADLRKIATTYFGFLNALVKANLGLTRKEAAIAYRASKFFPVREELIRQMREEDVPDPGLATVLRWKKGPWQKQGEYRYDVIVQIDFGGVANVRDFPVQVFSKGPLSLADAQNQAIWRVLLGFQPGSTPPDYGGTNKVMKITTSFEGFNRIEAL